jgi:ABC-2 type transport system permease protein
MKGLISFQTLIEREYYRFMRLAGQTLVPPVLMSVLFIIIFGYSLGPRIREISGFSYIIFILPGLVGMGVLNNAYSNTITSLYMARTDRSIENILVSPNSYLKIVSAFVIGGVTRGFLIGALVLAVAIPLTGLSIKSLPIALLLMMAIATAFSSFGVITALWAETWDHLATISNFILIPFSYLGGVFYSIDMLPGVWRTVSLFNPLFYMIDGLRWAVLGRSDIAPIISISITLSLAVGCFAVAVYLFKKGYKLIV